MAGEVDVALLEGPMCRATSAKDAPKDPSEAKTRSLAVLDDAMVFLRGGLDALQDR
jgi:hypothetical protein